MNDNIRFMPGEEDREVGSEDREYPEYTDRISEQPDFTSPDVEELDLLYRGILIGTRYRVPQVDGSKEDFVVPVLSDEYLINFAQELPIEYRVLLSESEPDLCAVLEAYELTPESEEVSPNIDILAYAKQRRIHGPGALQESNLVLGNLAEKRELYFTGKVKDVFLATDSLETSVDECIDSEPSLDDESLDDDYEECPFEEEQLERIVRDITQINEFVSFQELDDNFPKLYAWAVKLKILKNIFPNEYAEGKDLDSFDGDTLDELESIQYKI